MAFWLTSGCRTEVGEWPDEPVTGSQVGEPAPQQQADEADLKSETVVLELELRVRRADADRSRDAEQIALPFHPPTRSLDHPAELGRGEHRPQEHSTPGRAVARQLIVRHTTCVPGAAAPAQGKDDPIRPPIGVASDPLQ